MYLFYVTFFVIAAFAWAISFPVLLNRYPWVRYFRTLERLRCDLTLQFHYTMIFLFIVVIIAAIVGYTGG